MRRRLVSTMVWAIIAAALIMGVILAFNSGQHSQCEYWRSQGTQWAIDKYCGPSR